MTTERYKKQRLQHWHSRGVDISDYQVYVDMYNAADGRCEVCGRPLAMELGSSDYPTAQLDHDHRTHKPRGILCAAHNNAIGYLERRSKGFNRETAEYIIKKFTDVPK